MSSASARQLLGVSLSVLVLFATGVAGPSGASPAVAAAASPTGVDFAWRAPIGTGGANGTATVRSLNSRRGSVVLSLRRLTAMASYPVTVRRGSCGSLGKTVVTVGTFKATAAGSLAATAALGVAQLAAIRGAAVGANRISLDVGTASQARCGTLAKSLAVTPQIWLGPRDNNVVPWVPAADRGVEDFNALLDPGAGWSRVAGATHVFGFASEAFDSTWTKSDAVVRQRVAELKARDIAIAIGFPPLVAKSCGQGVEGFAGGAAELLPVLRRVARLGGTVRYIELDEPFDHAGVTYDGPGACHWSTARIAGEVAAFVRAIHAEFPAIQIGLAEPFRGPQSVALVKEWVAASDKAVGGRLPFFHLDVDWTTSWQTGTADIQSWIRARGTRFGLVYHAWPPASSDAEWFAAETSNILAFELDGAGPPDDAVFASWTDKPDHALPETGATTMTRVVADYLRMRTRITSSVIPLTGGAQVTGTVVTLGGDPVSGRTVSVTATPRDGPYQLIEFRGRVPAGQSTALIQVQVNQTPLTPGPAELTFYEFGYAEGAETANRVPNPRLDDAAAAWGHWGEAGFTIGPSDRGNGSMMRISATPTQTMIVNSATFAVTGGAEYRVWVAARVPEGSVGTTGVNLIVFGSDATESQRVRHLLAPVPISLGTATTDAGGAYALQGSQLEPGRYHLLAEYGGDAIRWPARARSEVTVP